MVKKAIKLVFFVLFFAGCALKQATPVKAEKPKNATVFSEKDNTNSAAQTSPTPLLTPVATDNTNNLGLTPNLVSPPASPVEAAPSAAELKGVTRVGLIFSGGGAKAWGHVGVLKQIEAEKWPIRAVAGVEWGAAVAAIYANKLSANETEWEMLKIKEFEDLEQNSEMIFANKSVSDLKVPFVCPSLNIIKQEAYLLNRGQLNKLVPYCLAFPPLTSPYKQSIAVIDNISGLAQHLRATGAKKIILIDVMTQKNRESFVRDELSAENILWIQGVAAMTPKPQGVDDVIRINLDDYDIKDLDDKREIIAKAFDLSYDQIKKLSKKYGL